MNFLDSVADSVIDGAKNLICGIYLLSPTPALQKLAGDPTFKPGDGFINGFNALCGTPQPPEPITFGDADHEYYFQAQSDTGAVQENSGNYFGPITAISKTITNSPYPGYQRVNFTHSNPNRGGPFQASINFGGYYNGSATVPSKIVLLQYGNNLPAPGIVINYPPLTAEQADQLDEVLKQLAAVRNAQGYALGAIGALGVGLLGIEGSIGGVAAAVAAEAATLAAIEGTLAQIIALMNQIKTELDKVDTKLGSGIGNDCEGHTSNDLTSAIQQVNNDLCLVKSGVGIEGTAKSNQGIPQKETSSLFDFLSQIYAILGKGDTLNITYCGTRYEKQDILSILSYIDLKLGFEAGSTGVVVPDQPAKVLCSTSTALQDLALYSGDGTFIVQGFEKVSATSESLHIVMNYKGGLAPQGFFTIPAPRLGLTKESILAAILPQTRGDYYCQLALATGRQVQGWFASEQAGLTYLERIATLSSLAVVVGSFSATHRAGKSPLQLPGMPLRPVKASLYGGAAQGQAYNVIYLQQ